MTEARDVDEGGPDFSGETVGRWILVRRLGAGAFGTVYEARHATIATRRAAVKVLHPALSREAGIKRRFVNEATAASQAEHENIVQIFDAGVTEDGLCYLAMEFLVGRTLGELAAAESLDERRVAGIAVQVARALGHAHGIGIVHRDLKPENVFIVPRQSSPDFVKVLDFGVAKLFDEAAQRTATGAAIGTPRYMSPEQCQGAASLDGRSDIYSLGVVLFELLARRPPFSAANPMGLLLAHVAEPAPRLADVVPVSAAMSDLVARLLAKEPAARPPTMFAVASELGAMAAASGPIRSASDAATLLESTRAPSRSTLGGAQRRIAPPTLASSTHEGDIAPPAQDPPRRERPRGTLMAIVCACVVALTAWLTVLLSRAQSHVPTAAPLSSEPALAATASPSSPVPRKAMAAPPGMIRFEGGKLHMGREPYSNGKALDVPPGEIVVRPFALARTEVTVDEYRSFVALGHPAPWPAALDLASVKDRPVVNIPFDDALAYCRFRFPKGRLPAEAEWEWAARGSEGRLYPFGDRMRNECVNAMYGDKALLVDESELACGASPEGLLHLSGNAAEWTGSEASVSPGAPVLPRVAGAPPTYIVRGGSFHDSDPDALTSTAREFARSPSPYIGFRCAADVEESP